MRKETYFDKPNQNPETPELRTLEMYLDGILPELEDNDVSDWLTNAENKEKEEVFEELWHKRVEYNPVPGREAYEMYGELAERLGFPTEEKRFIERSVWRIPVLRVAAVVIPLLMLAGAVFVKHSLKRQDDMVAGWVKTEKEFLTEAEKTENAVIKCIPTGEKGDTLLPDGTYVLLEEGTEIVYDENGQVFISGEGFFRAPKTREKPMVVKTPYMNVTVLGTTFNVETREEAEENTICLYSGSVEIQAGSVTHTLSPGMQLSYNKETGELTEKQMGRILPEWVVDELSFEGKPLADIFGKLEWFYNTSFDIGGGVDTAQAYTFTMNGGETLDNILEMMEKAGSGFTHKIENGTVYIR